MMRYIVLVCFSFVICMLGCATDVNPIGGNANLSVNIEDAGDCLDTSRCEYPVDKNRDVYTVAFEGNTAENAGSLEKYIATFDKVCRQHQNGSWNGDIDYIPIQTQPGTPLSVSVQRTSDGEASPIVWLLAKNGGDLIYVEPADYGYASLSFLAPDDLFYIRVEEWNNFGLNFDENCSRYVSGGKKYKYQVHVEKIDKEPISLGYLSNHASFNGHISEAGNVNYYTFTANPDVSFEIILHHADKSSQPTFSQIDRNKKGASYAGGYAWIQYGDAMDPSFTHGKGVLDASKADCSSESCEYWFAVTDYEGKANYDYQIEMKTR